MNLCFLSHLVSQIKEGSTAVKKEIGGQHVKVLFLLKKQMENFSNTHRAFSDKKKKTKKESEQGKKNLKIDKNYQKWVSQQSTYTTLPDTFLQILQHVSIVAKRKKNMQKRE